MVEKLRERGAAHIFIPRRQDYDLVQQDAVLALLHDARPDLIIHLAARVGGIGANLTHQAEYFYENLMMGTQLLQEAYVAGVPKFVAVGAICGYPKFAPIPFREEDLWNGYIKDLTETIARLRGFHGRISRDTTKPNSSTGMICIAG